MLCEICHNSQGCYEVDNYQNNGGKTHVCRNCKYEIVICIKCKGAFLCGDTKFICSIPSPICFNCSKSFNKCNMCNHIIYHEQESSKKEYCKFCLPYYVYKKYSYKPEPVFHQVENEKDDLFMGVELEVGGCANMDYVIRFCESNFDNIKNNLVYFKKDCSIPSYGVEIVSHPCTLRFHKEKFYWDKLIRDLSFYCINSRRGCGMHIHVNRNILNSINMHNLDKFFNNDFSFMRNFTGRNPNRYCEKVFKNENSWGTSMRRFEMINFTNRNTIEFRIFSSTSSYNTFIERLEFVHSLINFIKNVSVWEKDKTLNDYISYLCENKSKYVLLYKKAKLKKLL